MHKCFARKALFAFVSVWMMSGHYNRMKRSVWLILWWCPPADGPVILFTPWIMFSRLWNSCECKHASALYMDGFIISALGLNLRSSARLTLSFWKMWRKLELFLWSPLRNMLDTNLFMFKNKMTDWKWDLSGCGPGGSRQTHLCIWSYSLQNQLNESKAH